MNTDALAAQLRIDEGVRPYPYLDTMKKLTIGCGRNLDDVGLSQDEITYLLNNDIEKVCAQLDVALPWWRQLTERRQQVLANMCFNLGIRKFLGFPKMLAAMQSGRYDEAAAEMLDSKWSQQVGDRAKRLAQMMKEG